MHAITHRMKEDQILNSSNVGVAEDDISNLPDEIIHHILSLVPTKCAMSTCILSKGWKYVADSTPILDFRNWRTLEGTSRKERKLETKCFMNFLDTVVYLHGKPQIQKFYLDLDEFFDESRLTKWIGTIMKRKIEEFGLSHLSRSSILPPSFFTCDSLTTLDLEMESTYVQFIIPNTVFFPKLKILRLAALRFGNSEASTRKFFSNCPILEELSLSGCWVPFALCIVNPTLRHLCITSCGLYHCMVNIDAPNLLTFSFSCDQIPKEFVLSSFPSLVEADVRFAIYYESKYLNIFATLFEKVSNAKVLKLCSDLFQVPSVTDILFGGSVTFNNLINLEISSEFRYTNINADSIATVRTFLRFLQLSHNLESIVFTKSIYNSDNEDDGCWSFDTKFSLSHLKSVKFKDFEGEPMEIDAIRLFLKCARFLETAIIVASPGLSKDHQLYVAKLLPKFPKPADCVVEFLTSSEDT